MIRQGNDHLTVLIAQRRKLYESGQKSLFGGTPETSALLADQIGRLVHDERLAWAREQPDNAAHPERLRTWDDLPEPEKDAARRVGMRVINMIFPDRHSSTPRTTVEG